jgi:hypothetical protein
MLTDDLVNLLRTAPVPKRRLWASWVLSSLVLVVLLILGIFLTMHFYRSVGAGSRLQEALAETDCLAPHWRLSEIEARRTRPREVTNAALRALEAGRLLPADCQGVPRVRRLMAEHPPQALLSEAQAEALRADLAKAASALVEARKLKDLPAGRFPIVYAADFVSTRPACEPAREAADLLACELLLLAQGDETDRALSSVRGILGCARAVGDEPLTASQRIRMDCRVLAAEGLQRALAQGVPSPGALRAVQDQLEAEEPEPLLYIALRGERGGYDWLMGKLQGGELTPREVSRGGKGLLGQLDGTATGGLREQRAALLRFMNQAVQAAELPPHERVRALRELDAAADRLPPVPRRVLVPFAPAAAEEQCSQARLRCAAVAVAAERFRLRNGQWPAGLAELQRRGYLKEVPLDPYDTAPLRWRRLEDGLVIYTLGPDGKDNGGALSGADWPADGTDVGFRLWDAARRRQPSPTASPASPGEKRLIRTAVGGN